MTSTSIPASADELQCVSSACGCFHGARLPTAEVSEVQQMRTPAFGGRTLEAGWDLTADGWGLILTGGANWGAVQVGVVKALSSPRPPFRVDVLEGGGVLPEPHRPVSSPGNDPVGGRDPSCGGEDLEERVAETAPDADLDTGEVGGHRVPVPVHRGESVGGHPPGLVPGRRIRSRGQREERLGVGELAHRGLPPAAGVADGGTEPVQALLRLRQRRGAGLVKSSVYEADG